MIKDITGIPTDCVFEITEDQGGHLLKEPIYLISNKEGIDHLKTMLTSNNMTAKLRYDGSGCAIVDRDGYEITMPISVAIHGQPPNGRTFNRRSNKAEPDYESNDYRPSCYTALSPDYSKPSTLPALYPRKDPKLPKSLQGLKIGTLESFTKTKSSKSSTNTSILKTTVEDLLNKGYTVTLKK